jgi:hypothetical protein
MQSLRRQEYTTGEIGWSEGSIPEEEKLGGFEGFM